MLEETLTEEDAGRTDRAPQPRRNPVGFDSRIRHRSAQLRRVVARPARESRLVGGRRSCLPRLADRNVGPTHLSSSTRLPAPCGAVTSMSMGMDGSADKERGQECKNVSL